MAELEKKVEAPLSTKTLTTLSGLMGLSLIPSLYYLLHDASMSSLWTSPLMLPLSLAISPLLTLPLLTILILATRIPGSQQDRVALFGLIPNLLLIATHDSMSFMALKDTGNDIAMFLHSEQVNSFSRSFALCLVTLLALKMHGLNKITERPAVWIMPFFLVAFLCGLQLLDMRIGLFMEHLPTIVGISCFTAIFNIAILTKMGWEQQKPLTLCLAWVAALQLVNPLLFLNQRPSSIQGELLFIQNINDAFALLVPLPFLAWTILKQMNRPVSALTELNQKEASQGLNPAEAFAHGVAQAKSQLLSKLSHEFKTPLNTIIGYSELLVDELEEAKLPLLSDDLHKVNRAGWHLMTLVDDLLDVSTMDAESFKMRKNHFDAERFMQLLQRMAEKVASPHMIEIESFCQKGFGLVHADESRLLQVCMNVVRNSVRYSNNGKISLHFYSIIQDNQRFYTIDVRDSGRGMNPQELAKVFSAFESIQGESLESIYGLSLGIPVTKRLCELMGGTLSVDSSPGRGTTFSLTFPHLYNTSLPSTLKADDIFADGPVLLIDDDAEYTGFIQEIFESAGKSTLAVTKGRSGLRLYLEKRPRVVIVDLMMPELDGFAVIQSIRDQDPNCLIITISGQGWDSSEEKAKLAGSDLFFEKPMAIEAVLRSIEKKNRSAA